MKILFTASECVPFCKTGGLADVVGALAPVLAKKGHDVRVMLPLYSMIPHDYVAQMKHVIDFEVELGWRKQYCGIEALEKDGVTYYFIDNKYYFGRSYIYGMGGDEYERYGFFDRACLNALPLLDFAPDILHAHDWQAGMIPALLRIQYQHLPFYSNMKTVFTIHNLQYQGRFAPSALDMMGLPGWAWNNAEFYDSVSFMKMGLVYCDFISTVSETYAYEIQTPEYGYGMEGILRSRADRLKGIVNGIDYVANNPATDKHIVKHFDAEHPEGKAENKRALQERLGLEQRDVPVIGMITRLADQKGIDIFAHVVDEMMR